MNSIHTERVGAISICKDLLLTGSRDKKLLMHDLRSGQNPVVEFNGPKQEICGLKWSPDGDYFAVGSNDNSIMVFSPKTRFAIMRKRHRAAVKAIAWSDRQRGILASGGGTADCMIKIWSVSKYFSKSSNWSQGKTCQRKAHRLSNLFSFFFETRKRTTQHSRFFPKRSRDLESPFAAKSDFSKRTHAKGALPGAFPLWKVHCHWRRGWDLEVLGFGIWEGRGGGMGTTQTRRLRAQ